MVSRSGKNNQVILTDHYFSRKKMTTRNKRKLAALNKENCEEHPRSNLAQNSNAPGSQDDYITQVSKEIEGRVTKRLSKEFSRTENRILGPLARLDDFFMNPLLQGHSGTTPESSRNALSINQGTNEDDSQNDPHPEAGLLHGQMTQNSGPEDGHDVVTGATERHDMVTAAQKESLCGHDMVTGATEQSRNCHDMTGVHEKVTYCPLVHLQGSRRKSALPVNRKSAVRTPLQRSKQTKFCRPFSSWQITTILRTFVITSTKFPNCQSHYPQRCPCLTGNLRNLSCLKTDSRRDSKFIIS